MAQLQGFTEGMAAYRAGQNDQAIRLLTHLVGRTDLPGRIARYYTGMAHRAAGIQLMRLGQYEQATRRMREAISFMGNKADLAEYLCTLYARTGDHERSVGQADIVAGHRPGDVSAQVNLAQAQYRSGRGPLALLTLHQALRRSGDHSQVHLNLGLLYAGQGQYEQAQRHLLRATQCDCTDGGAYRHLGMVECMLEHFFEAASAFQRAYSLCGQDTLLAYQLCLAADAARRAGRNFILSLAEPATTSDPSQVRQLADYVACEPDFVESFLALPPSQADEELFRLITAVLKTAMADHGHYADLHYQASRAMRRIDDVEGAWIHARQAVQINPRYKQALVHLAGMEEQSDQPTQAAAHLEQAVSAGADWPDVHLHLGGLYLRTGRKDQAGEHYRRALELNENCTQAAEELRRLAA